MAETDEMDTETLNGEGDAAEGEEPARAVSGSSSGSDEEDDLQAESLERALAENPTNYDAHVQYVQCVRKLGDIEKLRRARKSMNEVFPMSPTMWQEWAKDEISLSESSNFSDIEDIYEKGVSEYLSVPLWCDYLHFVQEHDQLVLQCSPAGLEKMRGLYERAVTAAGLHIVDGNRIWDAYREFEQAIYLTIDESKNEERDKQLRRIRSLFHRQLTIPQSDMRSLLISYKLWEAESGNSMGDDADELSGIPPNIGSAFKKAIAMFNERSPYEEQLSKQDSSELDKLQVYLNYIKMEESLGDPVRVQMIYERAVSAFPVSRDLWLGYTGYLDRNFKVSSVLKTVYFRATRNCPWMGDLWVRYLLSLERVHAPEQELSSVFEKSLQFTFSSINEYLSLFLTRIDGLRRRISSAVANEAVYVVLRETFQHAAGYLAPQLTKVDDLLLLYAYWARLEVTLGKDLIGARGVWESLIKQCGMEYEIWKSYIAMEVELGHVNNARAIYKRCYSKRFNGNGSEEVCHSWLRFEREHGSLDDLDLATKKVVPRLEELKHYRTQQEAKNMVTSTATKDVSESDRTSKKKKMGNSVSDTSQEKGVRINKDAQSKKQLQGEDYIRSGSKTDDSMVAASSGVEKQSQKRARSYTLEENATGYSDQCTAFVSNINLKANEEDLRKFFNVDGGVSAIRLLKDKFTGRSRGLAYVDFMDENYLSAAIAKNKQKLLGKSISVARSNPAKSKKYSGGSGGSGPSKQKVEKDAARGQDREEEKSGFNDKREDMHIRRGNNVQLIGNNTFAVPRSVVRPLGWSSKESKVEEEQPKSNAEFKEMLLKN